MVLCLMLGACAGQPTPQPGRPLTRTGDEIMVAGQLIHTGAPVVLWLDPDGYDAYRVDRRFVPQDQAGWDASRQTLDSPNRYGWRAPIEPVPADQPREPWTLDALRQRVDQIVVHYDAAGSSTRCFEILHDRRGLSTHFMIDLDGTIYQTLDVTERAWHATIANDRSIGIEIANIGAYSPSNAGVLDRWYGPGPDGSVRVVGPGAVRSQRTAGFIARPARPGLIVGTVQGQSLSQFDYTAEQYESLEHLIAALCLTLPGIRCDAPRDARGDIVDHVLSERDFADFSGVLGHLHVQANKVDPGPAFQWDRVLTRARQLMDHSAESSR